MTNAPRPRVGALPGGGPGRVKESHVEQALATLALSAGTHTLVAVHRALFGQDPHCPPVVLARTRSGAPGVDVAMGAADGAATCTIEVKVDGPPQFSSVRAGLASPRRRAPWDAVSARVQRDLLARLAADPNAGESHTEELCQCSGAVTQWRYKDGVKRHALGMPQLAADAGLGLLPGDLHPSPATRRAFLHTRGGPDELEELYGAEVLGYGVIDVDAGEFTARLWVELGPLLSTAQVADAFTDLVTVLFDRLDQVKVGAWAAGLLALVDPTWLAYWGYRAG